MSEENHNSNYDNVPSIEELLELEEDGIAKATDGCFVELDGYCEHGKPSWLLVLGLI